MLNFIIITILLFVVFIVMILRFTIINWYNKKFKKDCFKCKHWYLHNVSSYGGYCHWKCKKNHRETIPMIKDNHLYVKCCEFENE